MPALVASAFGTCDGVAVVVCSTVFCSWLDSAGRVVSSAPSSSSSSNHKQRSGPEWRKKERYRHFLLNWSQWLCREISWIPSRLSSLECEPFRSKQEAHIFLVLKTNRGHEGENEKFFGLTSLSRRARDSQTQFGRNPFLNVSEAWKTVHILEESATITDFDIQEKSVIWADRKALQHLWFCNVQKIVGHVIFNGCEFSVAIDVSSVINRAYSATKCGRSVASIL
jgi:hypothetical protein